MKKMYKIITAGNKCYFTLVQLFKSKKTIEIKIKLHMIHIRPIVLYGVGTWASKANGNKLIVFKSKILRTFGPREMKMVVMK